MRLVAIHQPHYLPWLRYFEKIARADVFIVLDNIQFNKNGWQNRNRVKTAQGAQLLSVPVGHGHTQQLDEVRIAGDGRWARKHARTLTQAYAKAPYFETHWPRFEAVYQTPWDSLNTLNRRMLEMQLDAARIDTQIVYASDLAVPGEATERLINLVRAVDGDHYYSGAYALQVYLDADALAGAGIGLVLQEWHTPPYPQLHGEFVPDLAFADLLFNTGPGALDILRQGGRWAA